MGMGIVLSFAATPVNYLLIWSCLNRNIFSAIENIINDDSVLGVSSFDGKRLKFALFAWFFLEVVYFAEQILVIGVMISPKHNASWKINKPHLSYPSSDLVSRCIKEVTVSHLLRPLFLWMIYPVYRWRQVSMSSSDFPSGIEILSHLLFAVIIDDTLFYWAHRGLHENKWLYRNVHKKHHEFHYSIGIGTEYAHPLEDLLSNILPPFAGPFILRSHITVCISFFAIKLWQSVDAHCGFKLPFPMTPWSLLPGMDCAGAHDFHHSHNTGNYGGFFMFWDWLCGSDATYRKYISGLNKKN